MKVKETTYCEPGFSVEELEQIDHLVDIFSDLAEMEKEGKIIANAIDNCSDCDLFCNWLTQIKYYMDFYDERTADWKG